MSEKAYTSDAQHLSTDLVSARAADRAVKKVFAILGVDADNPEAVEAFREDRAFVRKLRKVTNLVFLGIFVAFMATIGISIVIRLAFWLGAGR